MPVLTDPNAAKLSFAELLTQEELYAEYQRLTLHLESAIANLYTAGKDWAEKDDKHRRAKAIAFVEVIGAKNKEEREAKADSRFAAERLESNIALSFKEATHAEVMARRTQMSALQTIIAARRSELEATSYGQTGNN